MPLGMPESSEGRGFKSRSRHHMYCIEEFPISIQEQSEASSDPVTPLVLVPEGHAVYHDMPAWSW